MAHPMLPEVFNGIEGDVRDGRVPVEQAAEEANVSSRTVARAEDEGQGVSGRSRRRLAVAYEAAGIEFLGPEDHGAGVRFRRRDRG